jgi:ABC-2 type transport system ATP-binding protein
VRPRRGLRATSAALLSFLTFTGLLVLAPPASAADDVSTEDAMVDSGSGADAVQLDTTLYIPASAAEEPAPAVVLAHGFGGSKRSVADDALDLAGRGYVVLTYSARGFGRSSGQIGLNDPRYEVADVSTLIDLLADRDEVALDGPGDPRGGVAGGYDGGAHSHLGAA